jgi:ribosomal protein S18 acetylase RimI-like enzyme
MATVIRRALPEDADTLSALANRTFMETFVEDLGVPYPEADLDGFLDYANSPEAMTRRLAERATAVWLAELDGVAVGYMIAGAADLAREDLEPSDGMIHRLYLTRSAQGTGLAGRMMDEVMAWLEANYGARPWLVVFSLNVRAQRFYARYGFEVCGEYDYPVGNWLDREFVMRRR